MTCEIMYATTCKATVTDTLGDHWEYQTEFHNLKDAINWATFMIDDGAGLIHKDSILGIVIWDVNTGEVLAECTPDTPNSEENYEDWDYNEDMGFDPYLGCYTDDC